jgi:hypothetical protein
MRTIISKSQHIFCDEIQKADREKNSCPSGSPAVTSGAMKTHD